MAKFSRNALMNSYIPQTQNYITILIIYPRKTNNKRIFHFISQLNLYFERLLYGGEEKRSKLGLSFQIVTQFYVDFLLRIKRDPSSGAKSVQLAY